MRNQRLKTASQDDESLLLVLLSPSNSFEFSLSCEWSSSGGEGDEALGLARSSNITASKDASIASLYPIDPGKMEALLLIRFGGDTRSASSSSSDSTTTTSSATDDAEDESSLSRNRFIANILQCTRTKRAIESLSLEWENNNSASSFLHNLLIVGANMVKGTCPDTAGHQSPVHRNRYNRICFFTDIGFLNQ
ncbi:hypothetical protein C9890_0058 [Perkinsus sp. BL_2016]|nr:hypothetical protein C9890_0058 [Perkinsus sp. BL_2016]